MLIIIINIIIIINNIFHLEYFNSNNWLLKYENVTKVYKFKVEFTNCGCLWKKNGLG